MALTTVPGEKRGARLVPEVERSALAAVVPRDVAPISTAEEVLFCSEDGGADRQLSPTGKNESGMWILCRRCADRGGGSAKRTS